MRTENTKWNPTPGTGHRPSLSALFLRSLAVGDVKRVFHNDLKCVYSGGHLNCSLTQEIKRLRRDQNWEIEYYHEAPEVLVIRRTK